MVTRKDIRDFFLVLSNPVGVWFGFFFRPRMSIEDFARFNALQLMCVNFCFAAMAAFVKTQGGPFPEEAKCFDWLPLVVTILVNALILMPVFKSGTKYAELLLVTIIWNFYAAAHVVSKLVGVFFVVWTMKLLSLGWIIRMVSAAEFLWIYYSLNLQLLHLRAFLTH